MKRLFSKEERRTFDEIISTLFKKINIKNERINLGDIMELQNAHFCEIGKKEEHNELHYH